MQPEQNNQPTQDGMAPNMQPEATAQTFTPPQFNTPPVTESSTFPQQQINSASPQVMPPVITPEPPRHSGVPKKLIIMAVVGVLLLASIVSALIVVLGGDDKSSTNSNNTSQVNDDTSNNEPSNSEDTNITPDPTEKSIDGSISDGPLKYDISVNKVVINVPFNSSASSYVTEENVGVLVEITASNNSDYYTSIGSYDFKMVTSSGSSEYESSYNLSEYAKSKSYTLLSTKSVSRGDTVTAWLAFEVPKDEVSNLKLRYERDERKGSDGTTLAAVKTEVPLN